MQHGLRGSSACSGLCFWRVSIVAEKARDRAVSAVPGCDGSALGVAADRLRRARSLAFYGLLMRRASSAADGHTVRRFGRRTTKVCVSRISDMRWGDANEEEN